MRRATWPRSPCSATASALKSRSRSAVRDRGQRVSRIRLLAERARGGAAAGADALVEADDPASGAGPVDDDVAGLGGLGGALVPHGVDHLDPDVQSRRSIRR